MLNTSPPRTPLLPLLPPPSTKASFQCIPRAVDTFQDGACLLDGTPLCHGEGADAALQANGACKHSVATRICLQHHSFGLRHAIGLFQRTQCPALIGVKRLLNRSSNAHPKEKKRKGKERKEKKSKGKKRKAKEKEKNPEFRILNGS